MKLLILFICAKLLYIICNIIYPLWNKFILPLIGNSPDDYLEITREILRWYIFFIKYQPFLSKIETSYGQELIPLVFLVCGGMLLLIFVYLDYKEYKKRFWRFGWGYGLLAIFGFLIVLFLYGIGPL